MEIRRRRGCLAGEGAISRIAYRVSRPFDAAQGRIAHLAEKRVLKENGRVVNQKKQNESIRQAQDKLAGFFNGPAVP